MFTLLAKFVGQHRCARFQEVVISLNRAGGDQDAAAWTSVDGITWSRVPYDEVVVIGRPR